MNFSFKNMREKYKQGSVIAYALGVISFVSILLLGLVQLIASQARFAQDTVIREKAFQITETCAQEYRWYLAHNTDGFTIEEVEEFWNNTVDVPRGLGSDPFEWDSKTASGVVIGKCSAKIINAPITPAKPVIVNFRGSTPEKPDIKKEIQVRFRRTSWSDYVVLSNEYANFDSKWDIKGKIMSNTGVHFDGVAHSRVYAGSATYFDPSVGANKEGVWSAQATLNGCEYNAEKGSCVFLGGKRYPIPQKDFSGIAVDLNAMKQSAQKPSGATINTCYYGTSNNCYFDVPVGKAGKHLTFRSDGKFDIVTVKDVKSNSNDIKNEDSASKQTLNIPEEGIIFIGGNVWVDGEINGNRVTVVSGEGTGDIYVGSGNLKYANRDGQDVIGLIAKGNILLTSEKKNCGSSCTDLEIDAAMVAKDGKIGKQDYNPNCCGVGCETQKNRIDIYGSVVSNQFIEFTLAKFCNGNSDTKIGFQTKNIEYDNNLYINPPPFFPSDVYYSVDSWKEL